MKFPNEYNWLESYLDNDTLWLEDTLNWDDVFDLITADFNILSFFTSAFFVNSHFFLDFFTKTSFLDTMLTVEALNQFTTQRFLNIFFWDLMAFVYTNFFPLQLLFFTDYQDFLMLIFQNSPELSLVLVDYITINWLNFTIRSTPSSVFDTFQDSLNSTLSEFVEYFIAFFIFFLALGLFIGSFRLLRWDNSIETYLVRTHSYLFTASRETRLQLEATLKVLFFFVLYFAMMIATFDDDQEELLEFFHGSSFYAFLLVFVYFLYRYSIHYFSFLQASTGDSRAISPFFQFAQDMANTFALMLRFGVLMLRLNIYDFLDDVLDSYYIFVCDFDDDEYFSELFFSVFSVMFFDTDNNDDRSFFLEDEMDFSMDLFSLYFIVWSKFSLFFLFALDEIARVLLAYYVVYLIIFEIQAVNRTYVEDQYLLNKRSLSQNSIHTNLL